MESESLQLKRNRQASRKSVKHQTVKATADELGICEVQLIHHALTRLRDGLLLLLPGDAPELSANALEAIRSRYGYLEDGYRPSSSLIDGV